MRALTGRWSLLGLAPVLLLAGCASRSLSPPQPAEHHPYVIRIDDYVRISVWRNPELSTDTAVDLYGKISLPLINDVQAAGLTPMELKQVLEREFSGHVTAPDVTVIVNKYDSLYDPLFRGLRPLREFHRMPGPQLPGLDRG